VPHVDRGDFPGAWHHVMNRGIARRPVFLNAFEIRNFLSRLARVVRRRELEVDAFAILATHFHLLVRSPFGRLSRTMAWIELGYVRWFNRRHERDGPLFRGRFRSKAIDSDLYRSTVIEYIHENPVAAGLAARASEYPWCSAWIEPGTRAVAPRAPRARWRRSPLGSAPLAPDPTRAAARAWLVERTFNAVRARDRGASLATPAIEELVNAAPAAVLKWMRRKTRMADGGVLDSPVAAPPCVHAAVKEAGPLEPSRRDALLAGLLRHACGLPLKELAAQLACSVSTAGDRVARHAIHLESDPRYAELAAAAAASSIRRSFDCGGSQSATRTIPDQYSPPLSGRSR